MLFFLHLGTAFTQSVGLTFSAVTAVWIIVAALQPGWLRSLLSFTPFTYTGRISYGWYLWHYPILSFGLKHVSHHLSILLVATAYPVAMASHRFVEKPFLKLKRRFEPGEGGPALNHVGASEREPSQTGVNVAS